MRIVASILVLAAVTGVASADGLVPPPKGKKFVSVTGEVLVSKDVKGYVFVQKVGSGGGRPGSSVSYTFSKVEPDETKPLAVPAPRGKFGSVSLLAVPDTAAKEFKTEKELFEALEKREVKGVQSLAFTSQATVDEKIKEKSVKWTYTITGVDEKGIKTTISGDGYEEPKKGDGKEDKPHALANPGYLIGGVAAALGVTFGGLWLVRRKKQG